MMFLSIYARSVSVETKNDWSACSKLQVRAVLGLPDDPKLPPDSVDAVGMLKTNHEFAHPQLLLRNLIPALRPSSTVADGTLGLEDQRLKGHPSLRLRRWPDTMACLETASIRGVWT